MLGHVILSAVQMRIILALSLNGEMGTASLLQEVRMSGKTWSRERTTLRNLGLLTSERRRILSSPRIKLVCHHRLTGRGEEVAGGILEISESLTSERIPQTALG